MPTPEGLSLYTTVDDEMYEELAELSGQKIVHFELWEDSLSDALGDTSIPATDQVLFDLDLYLADGVYFELYGTTCHPDPASMPIQGLEALHARLLGLVQQGAALAEVAVDEEDNLVLVLGQGQTHQLYLAVGGWLLEEWDELPDA